MARQATRNYWKVSVFDEKRAVYIVKAVNLMQHEAKNLVRELELAGMMARASRHKNDEKEYYYGK